MSRDIPPVPVVDRLFAEGYAFDFFQAVRLLQALDPARVRVGRGGPPRAEAVRFRTHASLNFPPSSIYDLTPSPGEGVPAELVQPFLGLTGPRGVLPRHYTELVLRLSHERQGTERFALRDWFDLFNHRFASLFYRAWEKYRPYLERERPEAERPDAEGGTFTGAMLSFVGVGTTGLQGRLVVPNESERGGVAPGIRARVDDLTLIHYSGLFAQRPRSAVGLRAILRDYFGLAVEVEQFRGRWLLLEPSSQSRLIDGTRGSNQLGANVVVGEHVWDVQGSFRIQLGPLTYREFRAFLPDRRRGASAFLLAQLVRLYVGPELDFDLQLILRADEVPQCQLPVGPATGPVLGWDCWLASGPLPVDASDVVFDATDLDA